MRGALVIASRDLRSAFESPLAHVLIAAYLAIGGVLFAFLLLGFSDLSAAMRAAAGADAGLGARASIDASVTQPLLRLLAIFLSGLVPLLTMRALAEEKRTGTMELLLTSPVEPHAIVVGKFLGAMGIVVAALALTATYPLMMTTVAAPDVGPLLTGYLGLVLVAAAFVSLGLLASALVESTVAAAFVGFAFIVASAIFGAIGSVLHANIGILFTWMSPLVHIDQLAAGVIDTADLAFFALFVGFNLFLTLRVVDSHRWR